LEETVINGGDGSAHIECASGKEEDGEKDEKVSYKVL